MDAPEDDRDEYDPGFDYEFVDRDRQRPLAPLPPGYRPAPAPAAGVVGAPLAPAGAAAVPVPGADQAAAAQGLANMHAAAAAAAAAAQAAVNANAKVPPGVLPKAGLAQQQILGVDVNTLVAAILAAQGQAEPPPAAKPKPVMPKPAVPKAAVPDPGGGADPEEPVDDGEHVTPDDSWDAPMRQLYEMFRRHRIPPQVVDAFHRHGCTTPYDVMTAGTNKEKAQANMCLSLLASSFCTELPPFSLSSFYVGRNRVQG